MATHIYTLNYPNSANELQTNINNCTIIAMFLLCNHSFQWESEAWSQFTSTEIYSTWKGSAWIVSNINRAQSSWPLAHNCPHKCSIPLTEELPVGQGVGGWHPIPELCAGGGGSGRWLVLGGLCFKSLIARPLAIPAHFFYFRNFTSLD